MVTKIAVFRSGRKPPAAPTKQALQFLIVLLKTNPLIWRRIQVPEAYSFWDLHVAIQDAMGWQDCHLHEFRIQHSQRGVMDRLGLPDSEFPDERPCRAGWEVPLSEYFNWDTLSDAPSARYVYDFGDEWHHLVAFEDILPSRSSRSPRCIAGARACPPEDCGGVHGFEDFLVAVSNPNHPAHAELKAWSGGSYDPTAFDPRHIHFDDPRKRVRQVFQD